MLSGKVTPLKAIRLNCLDCSDFHPSEVRNCEIPECPLFTVRMGKNPNGDGVGIGKKISNPTQKSEG